MAEQEFERDTEQFIEDEVVPTTYPMSAKKEAMFKSQDAVNFEKGTIAHYDNHPIVRSQVPDDHLPNVDSNFPSSEQSTPMPELNDHEYR